MADVRFGLIGIGGYARQYVRALDVMRKEGRVQVLGAVARHPGKYPDQEKTLREAGAPFFSDTESFYQAVGDRMDIVGIPTGISSHCKLTVDALNRGYNVLLEKPPAATIQEIDRMIAAARAAGTFCAVGFQGLTSPTIRGLKQRVVEGRFGQLKRLANQGRWKRLDSYFARNDWAGRLKNGDQWILDGPLSNALAHQMNNQLFLATAQPNRCGVPVRVRAEMYHAHNIEGEDCSSVELETDEGVQVCQYVTFCSRDNTYPEMVIEGTKAKAHWSMKGQAEIEYDDGTTETLVDDPVVAEANIDEMFRNVIRVLNGEEQHLNCSLEMTRSYVLAINGAYESNGWPRPVPAEYVERVPEDDSVATYVQDIDATILRAFDEHKLFSDIGTSWAEPSPWFSLEVYSTFDKALPE